MPKITPCLWCDGTAEEAANFYVSVFKNSRITDVSRYTEAGPGPAGSAMMVAFELDGQPFTALNGGPQFKFSEAISFQFYCDTQAELDRYWELLTEGGEESQCGWLKDKFGLSWQVVPSGMAKIMGGPDRAGAKRAMEAMFKMKKLDIAVLQAAYDG